MKTILKGVVRAEKIQDPSYYITGILEKVKPKLLAKLYGIVSWTDTDDFLEKIARRMGKLRKGGVPDVTAASKIVFHDWQRGRIPYFESPPVDPNEEDSDNEEKRKIEIEKIRSIQSEVPPAPFLLREIRANMRKENQIVAEAVEAAEAAKAVKGEVKQVVVAPL